MALVTIVFLRETSGKTTWESLLGRQILYDISIKVDDGTEYSDTSFVPTGKSFTKRRHIIYSTGERSRVYLKHIRNSRGDKNKLIHSVLGLCISLKIDRATNTEMLETVNAILKDLLRCAYKNTDIRDAIVRAYNM